MQYLETLHKVTEDIISKIKSTTATFQKSDELIEFVEKIHRMLNAYIRSIGRLKDETYTKPSYEKNREETITETKEESNGNIVEADSAVEPDGNSFTANADEFFSEEELTNA
jgi:hypothetical protein